MYPPSWYSPYMMPNGSMIYGAAALNRRIADKGGMDQLIYDLEFKLWQKHLKLQSGKKVKSRT